MRPRTQRISPLARLTTLAITAMLAASPGLAVSEIVSPEKAIDEIIAVGLRHNAEGNYDAARSVWTRLGDLDPAHPAAHVYATETLFWRMVHEENGTGFDDAIDHECDEAIRKAQAWVDERPDDAFGHFYLGQALMHLGRLHGIRARVFSAWRLGERGRKSLEHTLELDPDLTDAKLPIGLYYYYASLAPGFFNWLGFLWFVPSGHGDEGLALMEDVAREGVLHQMTAEFHLANIRSGHPMQIDLDRAHSTYCSLHERYPNNAIVHFQLLESLEMRSKWEVLVREAQRLEAHPGDGRHHRGLVAMARVWRARGEMMLHRVDDAWKTLSTFGENDPLSPDWGARWVKITRAQLHDLRGERDRALALYRDVLALDLDPNFSRIPTLAKEGIARPFRLNDVESAVAPVPRPAT
jgi:tetratricopeptide (TPR) repeat protein